MPVVASRYEIVRPLGSGGMGTVYLVNDSRGGGQVALKRLHPQYADRRHYVSRFEKEAELACRLRHPNVCAGLERGHEDGIPYFTMELLTGRSLAQIVSDEGCVFDPGTALSILAQAAAGLVALVSQTGVIAHRDLSSANIFLEPSGVVKIADFGIAKLETGNETGTGSFLGNVNYMSPEQINDPKRVDVRSDIYTLGVVLYEMLAGRRPFDGSPTEIANKHLYSEVPSLRVSGPGAEVAQDVLAKTLAKNPTDRFQDPRALVSFISANLPDVRPTMPRRRLVRRPGMIAAFAGAGALVLGVVFAFALGAGPVAGGQSSEITSTPAPTADAPSDSAAGSSLTFASTVAPSTIPDNLSVTLALEGVDPRARVAHIRIPSAQVDRSLALPDRSGTTSEVSLDVPKRDMLDGTYLVYVSLYRTSEDSDASTHVLQDAPALRVTVQGNPRPSGPSGTSGSSGVSVGVPGRNNSTSVPSH